MGNGEKDRKLRTVNSILKKGKSLASETAYYSGCCQLNWANAPLRSIMIRDMNNYNIVRRYAWMTHHNGISLVTLCRSYQLMMSVRIKTFLPVQHNYILYFLTDQRRRSFLQFFCIKHYLIKQITRELQPGLRWIKH